MLPVSEIFETLQCEASFAGTPAVFIRLQGCDVGCPWCDVRHSWGIDTHRECSVGAMLGKARDDDTYARLAPDTITGLIGRQFQARHVVVTGGEPCLYDLHDLSTTLLGAGYSVQIETSGTADIRCDPRTWVTLSPKIGMPGGKAVLSDTLLRADEIKVPVARPADIYRFTSLWNPVKEAMLAVPVWLQPISASQKATALCIQTATACGWRVSLPAHKFIGVRQ